MGQASPHWLREGHRRVSYLFHTPGGTVVVLGSSWESNNFWYRLYSANNQLKHRSQKLRRKDRSVSRRKAEECQTAQKTKVPHHPKSPNSRECQTATTIVSETALQQRHGQLGRLQRLNSLTWRVWWRRRYTDQPKRSMEVAGVRKWCCLEGEKWINCRGSMQPWERERDLKAKKTWNCNLLWEELRKNCNLTGNNKTF